MVVNIKAFGRKVKCMVKVCTQIQKERKLKAYGLKAIELLLLMPIK
jgi:hypothetical protein